MTMSNEIEKKLLAIRKAEGITQQKLSDITGISLGTIKNYERGFNTVGLKTLELIVKLPQFEKYTLWLMTGKTAPAAGQICPALSPDGHGKTSARQKGKLAG